MTALRARDGSAFSWGRTLLWSSSWALGTAAGVALGAWLTVVGEAGAPGAAAIDPGIDFLALPLGAAGAVFIVHLAVQLVVASWRGTRNTPRE